MPTQCRHQERCTIKPSGILVQTRLAIRDGRLSYASPPKPPYRRTPAPNAVRRIANTPTFSTTDPSLTSFLRFPPEIRIAIYQLLLRCWEGTYIQYHICTILRRLVVPRAWCPPGYPYIRHDLFPAILGCCRTTHREGSQVLYGENQFSLGCFAWDNDDFWGTVNSWPLGESYLAYITRLRFGMPKLKHAPLSTQLAIFPSLRRLAVERTMSGREWAEFLGRNTDVLWRIPRVDFQIQVSQGQIRAIYRARPSPRAPVDPAAACKKLYLLEITRKTKHLGGRGTLTWRFQDLTTPEDCCDGNWEISMSLESFCGDF